MGAAFGAAVGVPVGVPVGAAFGGAVGAALGGADGAAFGGLPGEAVGDAFGGLPGEAVGDDPGGVLVPPAAAAKMLGSLCGNGWGTRFPAKRKELCVTGLDTVNRGAGLVPPGRLAVARAAERPVESVCPPP